jgi:hypothetical protein
MRTSRQDTYTCSHRFRPEGYLQYEHMFCSSDTPTFSRRLLGALRLVRSFLLLEDDYEVDWEVDRDEWAEQSGFVWEGCDGRREPREGVHPHRMALRSQLGARRPGTVVPHEQICLCPVGGRARAGVSRGSLSPERSCAEKPRGVGSSRNP